MIVGLLGLATVSAISARCAVRTFDAIFSMAEKTKFRSSQTLYGHTFICQTNHEFRTLQIAINAIEEISEQINVAINGSPADAPVIQKKVLEGTLGWAKSGRDLGDILLLALEKQSTDTADLAADAIEEAVSRLSLPERQALLALHNLLEETDKTS